jgi:hypothetical protein
MKKIIIASLTASVMFLFTASAYADSILQIWDCELNDDKTPADVIAASSVWLKAAKNNEGGEDIEVFVEFPFVGDAEDGDFFFVLSVADTKIWGVFNHDYPDSPAGEAEEAWAEVATCSDSSLSVSVEIE